MIGPLPSKLIELGAGDTLVLESREIIDGTGDSKQVNRTVVIEGERIRAIGPREEMEPKLPEGARRIDCTDKTIMPGLIDLHVHYLGEPSAESYRAKIEPVPGQRVIQAALDLYRTLEGGFTTVRDLGHGDPNRVQALKQVINEGLIEGPRVFTSRWAISQTAGHGNLSSWPYEWVERERPRSTFADGVEGCLKAVRRNFGEGADLIKIYVTEGSQHLPNFTLEEIQTMTAEAHRRRAKVAAHAKSVEGVYNAILGVVDTVEHGTADPVPELFDLMAENGTIFVPTYGVLFWLAEEGEAWGAAKSRVESARRQLEKVPDALLEARKRGVKIGLGTDTGHGGGPGVAKNAKALELLVLAGLTPMEAIVAGTQTAAEALGFSGELGTLEPGKLAEFIVVDGDPVADITCLQAPERIHYVGKTRVPLS
jgi:imidazolonepropionase-like amidohydrolase